jgi:hypothetical protein
MTNAMNDAREAASLHLCGLTVDGLRHLSIDEFRVFGLPTLAYLREGTSPSGAPSFAIHAADGTELIEVEALDNALELAAYNRIMLVATQ